jgi:polysaccharide biosynthesis protein PslG
MRRVVAACALALVVSVCAANVAPARTRPAAAVAPKAPIPPIGATFHGTWDYADDAQRAAALDKLAAGGLKSIRLDLCWCDFEQTGPGTYNPNYVRLSDSIVDAARARGLDVLVTLWGTPAWANGGAGLNVPPTDPSSYANAAEGIARHFRGRVVAWEVWNEPNLSVFWRGTAADYAQLLRPAYRALKAGDPSARVLFGGLSYNDDAWLKRAYEAGAGGAFDVMATHPYQGRPDAPPEAPDDGKRWWLTHVPSVRRVMKANGDARKPIWFTEFGWSTFTSAPGASRRGVTPAQQADYLLRTIELVRSRYPYVQRLYWYNDRDTASGNAWEDNLGLLKRDLGEKPVYTALRQRLSRI